MAFDKSSEKINWRNFFICFFLSLGCWGFAYPSSVIATVIAEPSFNIYFDLLTPDGKNTSNYGNAILGALNGVYQAGAFFNVFGTSLVMDKWGRKVAIYWCSVLGIIGGAIFCGSVQIAMALVGRFILGASAWGFLVLTPIFCSEISPPAARGFFVGLNGFNISFGYAIATYMGLAFSYAGRAPGAPYSLSNTTWRGPLGIYLVIPFLMIGIGFLAPESPRYLLLQDRVEEARKVTMSLHRVGNDYEFAREEFYQMSEQTKIDRTLKVGWLEMFTNKSYRKRTALALFYSFLGQSTAVLVLNNYGPTWYSGLGYGFTKQLIFQAGWVTVGYPFCFLGAFLMDRVGRRPLMIFGIGGCCACVIVLAASTAQIEANPNDTACAALGVAGLYIFIAIYSVGVDVGGNVFYSEVFPNHVRSKGVALANAVLALSDLLYLELTPTAEAAVGYKWFLLFIIISGLGAITLYFVLPETKGVPLEEMARIFNDADVAVYSDNVPHYDANGEKKSPVEGGGEEGYAHTEKVKETGSD